MTAAKGVLQTARAGRALKGLAGIVSAGPIDDLRRMIVKTRPIEDMPPSPVCSCGGGAMTLVRVTPRLGAFPELSTYRCDRCGAVESVEITRPVALAG